MKIECASDEIYWLAGYLEGEGTFHAGGTKAKDGTYPTLAIQVTSVDLDVIQKVGKLIGRDPGPVKNYDYEKSFKGPRQQQYRVRIYGAPALALMMLLYPLMGTRRQMQIHKAMNQCSRLQEFLGGLDNQD